MGEVEFSTKIRLGKLGAAEFGCRVSSGRSRVLVDGWNPATGVAAARMAESMTCGADCAAKHIGTDCPRASFN